jgi:RimJ/RimL family protein N-acetyltransferase
VSDIEIYIRPLIEKDAYTSFKWRNKSKIWKLTGSSPNIKITPKIEFDWVRKVLNKKDEMRFAICIKEKNEYIGNVQLTKIKNYKAEFHIFIGEEKYWNKGIGSIATLLLIDYVKKNMNLNQIYLYVDKENIAAYKVYKKCGFSTVKKNKDFFMVYNIK